MAIYHLHTKIIGRSQGRKVVAAAAYRSAQKLYDFEQKRSYNFTQKKEVVHSEILVPENSPKWMQDRTKLWNHIEKIENRKNSQLAREVEFALPIELSTKQTIKLAKEYVIKNFVKKGMVADLNIHDKKGNPHAHVLLTTRNIENDAFGKKNRNWNKKGFLLSYRKAWADTANKYLKKIKIRISHESYKDRGILKKPQTHIGTFNFKKQKDLLKKNDKKTVIKTVKHIYNITKNKLTKRKEKRMHKTEIKTLKDQINLVDFICSKGFQIDKKESYKKQTILRLDGEKISVTKKKDWVYYDFRKEKGGDIIHFLKHFENKSIPDAIKELKDFSGTNITQEYIKPKIEKNNGIFQPPISYIIKGEHEYLKSRHIDFNILKDKRFENTIFTDKYKNAVFPNYNDKAQYIGAENRNENFRGFVDNSSKGFWFSNKFQNDNKMIITESPINALSHFKLHKEKNAFYASIGGNWSAEQQIMLSEFIKDKKIIVSVATDNDKKGHDLYEVIKKIVEKSNCEIERDIPLKKGSDWNDVLRERVINRPYIHGINLAEYAMTKGYKTNYKISNPKNDSFFLNKKDDFIVVGKNKKNDWMYVSEKTGEKGNIMDFMKNKENKMWDDSSRNELKEFINNNLKVENKISMKR